VDRCLSFSIKTKYHFNKVELPRVRGPCRTRGESMLGYRHRRRSRCQPGCGEWTGRPPGLPSGAGRQSAKKRISFPRRNAKRFPHIPVHSLHSQLISGWTEGSLFKSRSGGYPRARQRIQNLPLTKFLTEVILSSYFDVPDHRSR
jgi:hypothetical protein